MTEPQESHGILKVSKKDTTVKKFHWNEDNLEENEKIQKELVRFFSFLKFRIQQRLQNQRHHILTGTKKMKTLSNYHSRRKKMKTKQK
jgi:hypothetical protein